MNSHRFSKKEPGFFLPGSRSSASPPYFLSFLLFTALAVLPLRTLSAQDETLQEWTPYLESQLLALKKDITLNPDVIRSVAQANQTNAHFSLKEIAEMDRQWRGTEGVDLFIVSLITNDLADKLKEFQKKQGSLVEIFITDRKGLLIAATNKTSDFYQADEAWWRETVERNNPKGAFGGSEYDESALVEDIPLYLVIRGEQQEVIGVLKAVCEKNRIPKGAF